MTKNVKILSIAGLTLIAVFAVGWYLKTGVNSERISNENKENLIAEEALTKDEIKATTSVVTTAKQTTIKETPKKVKQAEREDDEDDDDDEYENNTVTTNPTQTPPAPNQTPSPAPAPTPAPTVTTFTLAQISVHNTSASCYSAVNGSVYDLTNWINSHPGGSAVIKGMCGVDATAAFNNQHGGQSKPENELASFKIGKLI
jgi:cytochrome b involved in lipid metabolism